MMFGVIYKTSFALVSKNKWFDYQVYMLTNKNNVRILEDNPNVTCVHTIFYSNQCERNIKYGKMDALIICLVLIFK